MHSILSMDICSYLYVTEDGMDDIDMDAADSGVGASLRPSSGRLSSLSHFSDGTIHIPDGRYSHM